jgi:hypothetical protein
MGWRGRTLLLIGTLLLPGTSAALDLDAGLRTSVEWDSNVRRTDGPGQTDDFIFRVAPLVRMLEDRGNFQWNLDYRFPYEWGVKEQKVDGFRHFLSGAGEYYLSERTRLYARNQFSKSEAVSRGGEDAGIDDTVTINSFATPVYRNRATVGVSHNFTPRTSGDFSFSYRYFDTDLPNRARNDVFAGSGRMSYALSPRHRVGGGVSATYQDFSESNEGTRPASRSYFLNVFATWVWLLDETTTLTLAGGPTFIDNKQLSPSATLSRSTYPYVQQGGDVFVLDFDSCGNLGGSTPVAEACGALFQVAPADEQAVLDGAGAQSVGFAAGQDPGQVDSSSWTFFAEASLAKRWSPVLDSELSYRRTDSTASGLGSAVLDSVRMIHTWRISERWHANFVADFTHRQSTSPTTQVLTEVQSGSLSCLDAMGGTFDCDVAMVMGGSTFLRSREIDNSIDTNRWGVGTSVSYRITRHLSAGLRYRFNSQASAKRTEGRPSDFGNHLVTLGFQYDFDRYSLDKYVPW